MFQGDFSDFRIPCKIEGMDFPLILSVFCDVKGLSVTYSVSQDAENTLYGKCSKISNTLKLRTPKIIAENNF